MDWIGLAASSCARAPPAALSPFLPFSSVAKRVRSVVLPPAHTADAPRPPPRTTGAAHRHALVRAVRLLARCADFSPTPSTASTGRSHSLSSIISHAAWRMRCLGRHSIDYSLYCVENYYPSRGATASGFRTFGWTHLSPANMPALPATAVRYNEQAGRHRRNRQARTTSSGRQAGSVVGGKQEVLHWRGRSRAAAGLSMPASLSCSLACQSVPRACL